MMAADKAERIRSIIGWMRKKGVLSQVGYYPGWEKATNLGVGVSLPTNDDDTSAPSIGYVARPTSRPKPRIVCMALRDRELPPAQSRATRKLPDLRRENPSFAAMLVRYVNERFGGDAPKVYNAAHVSRKTYSAIVGNELRPVSKAIAVQFALALRLTSTEADTFLKAAGYAFSAAILEDIIVCACIEEKVYDIADVNSLLVEYNAKPFASQEDV